MVNEKVVILRRHEAFHRAALRLGGNHLPEIIPYINRNAGRAHVTPEAPLRGELHEALVDVARLNKQAIGRVYD
jgi:hypothetical protein